LQIGGNQPVVPLRAVADQPGIGKVARELPQAGCRQRDQTAGQLVAVGEVVNQRRGDRLIDQRHPGLGHAELLLDQRQQPIEEVAAVVDRQHLALDLEDLAGECFVGAQVVEQLIQRGHRSGPRK